MVWRTMSEWNKRSRRVKTGETCQLKDPDGNCLWSKEQTKESRLKPYRPSEHSEYWPNEEFDYDYDDEWWFFNPND